MTREEKQKRQCYDVAKLIDMIEMAISAAVVIYGAAEAIIKAMFQSGENNANRKSK